MWPRRRSPVGAWVLERARMERDVRCASVLVGVAVLSLLGCAAPGSHTGAAAHPLGHLVPCDGVPFVAVFSGVTQVGRDTEKAGSTQSSDVYGVRPDGSVAAITDDLGTYEFGLADDGAAVYVSPYGTLTDADGLPPIDGPVESMTTSVGKT